MFSAKKNEFFLTKVYKIYMARHKTIILRQAEGKSTQHPQGNMSIYLSKKTLIKCMLRSNMVNCAYSTEALQSVGFIYAIAPGLRELYKDDESFAAACARYSHQFNTHPFWTPFLTGALLKLEQDIALGKLDPDFFRSTTQAPTLNTLSAIGDSFFYGGTYLTILLSMLCLVGLGHSALAAVLLAVLITCSLLIKNITFFIGVSKGLLAIGQLRRLNLPNLADYFKLFSALLLVTFLALALDPQALIITYGNNIEKLLTGWFAPIIGIAVFSYTVFKRPSTRGLGILVFIGTLFFLEYFKFNLFQ